MWCPVLVALGVAACTSSDSLYPSPLPPGYTPQPIPMEGATSGAIGCPPNEIAIVSDTGYATSPRTWTAVCRGQRFDCAGSIGHIQCTQELRPPT